MPFHFPDERKRAQTRPIPLSVASRTGFGGRTLQYVSPPIARYMFPPPFAVSKHMGTHCQFDIALAETECSLQRPRGQTTKNGTLQEKNETSRASEGQCSSDVLLERFPCGAAPPLQREREKTKKTRKIPSDWKNERTRDKGSARDCKRRVNRLSTCWPLGCPHRL